MTIRTLALVAVFVAVVFAARMPRRADAQTSTVDSLRIEELARQLEATQAELHRLRYGDVQPGPWDMPVVRPLPSVENVYGLASAGSVHVMQNDVPPVCDSVADTCPRFTNLCGDCKEAFVPDELALQGIGISPEQLETGAIYRSVGCEACVNTGSKGRIGIFEIMTVDSNLKSLILQSFDADRIKQEALKRNMVTLRMDGVRKVLRGMTTLEEVLRVTQK